MAMATWHKLVILLTSVLLYIATAEVEIENGGYTGLMIAIHEDVPETPQLLESIKAMISGASVELFNFTERKAYFKQVTIVVPSSWSTSPKYASVPKDDYIGKAEVRIAPPHPNYGNMPYTLQLGGCGERGQYIHLTPEFLLDMNTKTNNFGLSRISEIFLNEWTHLRYGVFNEFGIRGNKNDPIFYKDEYNKIRLNVCLENNKGWIRRSDGKSPCTFDVHKNLVIDCTFYPAMQIEIGMTNGSGKSSLKYMPELDYENEFCDKKSPGNNQNPSFPNMHQRMCNTSSVSSVMFNNEDFKQMRVRSSKAEHLQPEIRIVRMNSKLPTNFVLVLDVSSSMTKENRLKYLRNAATRLIEYHIKESCNIKLGMVSFASRSTVLANLTLVSKSNREQLIQKIPKSSTGHTSIGGGILQGIQVLRQSGEPTEKSKIILLSDGEENQAPRISNVTEEIKRSGVVIDTLAIGQTASLHLENLSKMTGGRSDLFNALAPRKSLDSILSSIILDGCEDVIINRNRDDLVQKHKDVNGTFDIDSSLKSTIVFMTYDPWKARAGKSPLAIITDPSGKTYNHQDPECTTDENLGSIQCQIHQVQPGKWNYRIENPGSEDLNVNVMITSDLKPDAKNYHKPISVNSWINSISVTFPNLPKIFTEVTKGDQEVVRANVQATIYRPDGTAETINLNDNGQGADRIAHDGVYTEFITRYNGDGRYQIDINVESTNQTRLLNRTQVTAIQRLPVMPIAPEEIQNDEPRAEFLISEIPTVKDVYDSTAIYTGDAIEEPDFDSMEPVENFQRFVPTGTFVLNEWNSKDVIPPGKIKDLKILATNSTQRTVHLEWTSTGDDMFNGQATTIDLRYQLDSRNLVQSFEKSLNEFKILKGNLDPLPAYKTRSIVIQLPPEKTFPILNSSRNIYFATRAFDEAGNVGEVSNVAIAKFPLEKRNQPTYTKSTVYTTTILSSPLKGKTATTKKQNVLKTTISSSPLKRKTETTNKPYVFKTTISRSPLKGKTETTNKPYIFKTTIANFQLQGKTATTNKPNVYKSTIAGSPLQGKTATTNKPYVYKSAFAGVPSQEKPQTTITPNDGQIYKDALANQFQTTHEPDTTPTLLLYTVIAITAGTAIIIVIMAVVLFTALKKLAILSNHRQFEHVQL